MREDAHDADCEAEFIGEAGAWTACRCTERAQARRGEDVHTNTLQDAARFERWRAIDAGEADDRPQLHEFSEDDL